MIPGSGWIRTNVTTALQAAAFEPDSATEPFSSVLSLLAWLVWHFFHHIISSFVFFWRYAKHTFWWVIQALLPTELKTHIKWRICPQTNTWSSSHGTPFRIKIPWCLYWDTRILHYKLLTGFRLYVSAFLLILKGLWSKELYRYHCKCFFTD